MEDLAGVGPETHHRRHQRCGTGADGRDYPSVAGMEAIKAAQRNRGGP